MGQDHAYLTFISTRVQMANLSQRASNQVSAALVESGFFHPIFYSIPRISTIIAEALPHDLLNFIVIAANVVKANVIPGEPNGPKGDAFQQGPVSNHFPKLPRRADNKDRLLPIRHVLDNIRIWGGEMLQEPSDRMPHLI
jgi:hypothetical protein